MRFRKLLEETLMGEEVEKHRLEVYGKTASAYMFGYAAFGKDLKIGTGYVDELDLGRGVSVLQRFRADNGHGFMGPHINQELFPNPVKPNKDGRIVPLINDHLLFDWKK